MGAIVPVAHGAGHAPALAVVPDLWSGEWPSQLMSTEGSTPLGTLVWRAIRHEEGMALVGKRFGGAPFVGCPADGRTRFFRGRYVEGGELIACTRGADGAELVGRFNGNDTFRSGSFTIRITADNPRFFFGDYVEDDGITTAWCGILERALALPEGVVGVTDFTAPTLRVMPGAARAGASAQLRFSVRDESDTVRVDLSVHRGAKVLTRLSVKSVSANGAARSAAWRVPRGTSGSLRVCAAALDRTGNTSPRQCTRLTVT